MAEAVFVCVVAARLLVPLGIPRRPLPFILAALLIDGVDQTIFDAVGADGFLRDYQSYDKALDVYYLTIAYTSTLRNWLDPFALGVARFLFYYRLVGTLAFELSGANALLLIFPNTFEYFFIFYEAVRLIWNPSRMSHRFVAGSAAAIWVFVKLPQEWWIHLADLDLTEQIGRHAWLGPAIAAGVLALLVAWRVSRERLPPADWGVTTRVDRHITRPGPAAVVPRRDMNAILSMATFEKVVLVSIVAVIFGTILDGIYATDFQVAFGVSLVVLLNSVISLWRVRHGTRYASTAIQFATMAVVNAAIVGAGTLLRKGNGTAPHLEPSDALFFLLLVTLIITLYDRYRVIGNLSTQQRRRPRPRLRRALA